MRKLIVICFMLLFSVSVFAELTGLVNESGVKGGIIVHLGCGDGSETAGLAVSDKYIVHGLDKDEIKIEQARKTINSKGIYGRISVTTFEGKKLPYADNIINLLIVSSRLSVEINEIIRVLVPGGVILIKSSQTMSDSRFIPLDTIKEWVKFVKPIPPGMDEWTHFLHGSDNNAVSRDTNINLPRSLQWVDGPKWGRSHEELASISALVTANGRIFYIVDRAPFISIRLPGQWYIVARDAYNGIELWNKPINLWVDHLRHFRTGPVHLPRRLVVDGDKVYVTAGLDTPVIELDAASGNVNRTYENTKNTEEIILHQGVLYLLVGSSETHRSGPGLFERGEPGPTPERFLMAVDVKTGKELWRKNAKGSDYIMPLGVALYGDKLFFHSIQGIGCLNRKTGEQLWLIKRKTFAKRYSWSTSTLVATKDVVLLADGIINESISTANDDLIWGVHGWDIEGFSKNNKTLTIAYSTDDGKELWSKPNGYGYHSPSDVFVVNDIVWLGPFSKGKKDGVKKGFDLKTGVVKKSIKFSGARVGMAHMRCHRFKASEKYIFAGRDGIEVIDLEKGWVRNNSWIRGMCQYGIMPANGLMYVPPDPCACHSKAKVQGFNAMSSYRVPSFGKPVIEDGRLKKGDAYGQKHKPDTQNLESWPMYRHDNFRSGAIKSKVTKKVILKWKANIGNIVSKKRLTQPIVVNDKVYVAAIDQHTLYALESSTGNKLWNFTAGGRIDSSPSYYKGFIMFGSADGCVYCLDSGSGKLVWRFNAAPEERYISVYGQIESAWPVHGSVLVQSNEVYFTAGRSSYVDGGIYFYRLNPFTGEMLAVNNITQIDPVTEKQKGPNEARFDSPGVLSDVLSGDGASIFLKHIRLDKTGKEQPGTEPHLFSSGGFLGEEWFVRSYWIFGKTMQSGWKFWADSTKQFPTGRILSIDGNRVYGYGRKEVAGGKVGHKADYYHLFSSSIHFGRNKPESGSPPHDVGSGKKYLWSKDVRFIVRAFVVTTDYLIAAGVPDVGKKRLDILAYKNEIEMKDALDGKKGIMLRLYSKTGGSMLAEYNLSAMPVFDGMSVANGKIFVALKNGTLECWE